MKTALLALLTTSALAADVYSDFYNSANQQCAPGVTYDVSNTDCFSCPGAINVRFTGGGLGSPNGPYCLTFFSEGGCDPADYVDNQQFMNLDNTNDQVDNYPLNYPSAGSFMWKAAAC